MRKLVEDLEEDGEDLDKALVDQHPADVQTVVIQFHIQEEHHAPVFPVPNVVQD